MCGTKGHEVNAKTASKANNALDLVPAAVGPLLPLGGMPWRWCKPHEAMFAFRELLRSSFAGSCKQVSESNLLWVHASSLEGFRNIGVVSND